MFLVVLMVAVIRLYECHHVYVYVRACVGVFVSLTAYKPHSVVECRKQLEMGFTSEKV